MADQELTAKVCEPCRGGIPPMDRAEAEGMLARVPGWTIAGPPDQLERSFKLKNFQSAQDFAVAVGVLAEQEGHHPDITYGWGYCTVRFYTHKIRGLHENDFIMAAKVDKLAEERGLAE
jgi:4a-hydroxytetrahydrobiopterin dehydratase